MHTQMHIDTLHSHRCKICPAAPEIASCGRPASPHRWWQERHSLRGSINLSIIFYLPLHISSYIHLAIQCSLIESTSFLPWSPVWRILSTRPSSSKLASGWTENSAIFLGMNIGSWDKRRHKPAKMPKDVKFMSTTWQQPTSQKPAKIYVATS